MRNSAARRGRWRCALSRVERSERERLFGRRRGRTDDPRLAPRRGALREGRTGSALSQVPTAFFATALRLTKTDEPTPRSAPIYVDPRLAKPPHNPGRLGLKERLRTLEQLLWDRS